MGKRKSRDSASEEIMDVSNIQSEPAEEPGLSYDDKLRFVTVIAKPMASRKLAKKIYKLLKKASHHKNLTRAGLKDVQKALRKGEKGLVVFAGDVTPIDIMCHLPGLCEDLDIPYCYTPSREDLGMAQGVRRPSLMVMIKEHPDYKEAYDEALKEVRNLPKPVC